MNKEYYLNLLNLTKHTEGGYFREFYRSIDLVKPQSKRYENQERKAGTSIYFLLEGQEFSAWHRLKSDEIWHYYDGDSPLHIHIIDEAGDLKTQALGNPRIHKNASFQAFIKAEYWFAAEIAEPSAYALVGCTVSPGFEYQDFELADRRTLVAQYKQHKQIIEKFNKITDQV